MKGGPASHGATKWHRRIGSVGAGRVSVGFSRDIMGHGGDRRGMTESGHMEGYPLPIVRR